MGKLLPRRLELPLHESSFPRCKEKQKPTLIASCGTSSVAFQQTCKVHLIARAHRIKHCCLDIYKLVLSKQSLRSAMLQRLVLRGPSGDECIDAGFLSFCLDIRQTRNISYLLLIGLVH